MKQILLFFITAFFCVNTYGQDSYIGKLINVTTLHTTLTNYILRGNYNLVADCMIFDNVEYFKGDIVIITGTRTQIHPEFPDAFYLEIESIKKWSPNPNVQHFLGAYYLEGMCKDKTRGDTFFPVSGSGITITKGIERDLLVGNSEAFVIDNSFFTPWRELECFEGDLCLWSCASASGEIKNDILFFQNAASGAGGQVFCEYKGAKWRYSDSITILPTNATTNDEIRFVAYSKSRTGDCTLELQRDSIVGNTVYISGKYDGSNTCRTGNGRNDTISLGSEFEQGTYTVVYSAINTQSPETAEILEVNFEVKKGATIMYGCTNPAADNYDPDATDDDGSCDYGTAVETLQATSLQIFPNPTTGQLTITGVETQCIASLPQTVEIYDNTGRLVGANLRVRPNNTIDISHLPNGVYFIQINGKRGSVVKR
ncbi:MAG: T9SS type A sorting domain-containing protein [Bacteroidetes bacterium]|nr:T9SS type A sorting domain-containing protein [Bacteroidota bacterium]